MSTAYLVLEHLHVTCVTLSGLGFVLRGGLMLADSPRLQARWLRIVPHVVDTLLLVSALTLAVLLGQYPVVDGWLTGKVLGLGGYILCGTMALKHGRTKAVRGLFLVFALGCFAYIVSVALSHSPWGFFLFLS